MTKRVFDVELFTNKFAIISDIENDNQHNVQALLLLWYFDNTLFFTLLLYENTK